jgi:hypothetical protein
VARDPVRARQPRRVPELLTPAAAASPRRALDEPASRPVGGCTIGHYFLFSKIDLTEFFARAILSAAEPS